MLLISRLNFSPITNVPFAIFFRSLTENGENEFHPEPTSPWLSKPWLSPSAPNQPPSAVQNLMEPLKILTNEFAENLGLQNHTSQNPSKGVDSGYISPSNGILPPMSGGVPPKTPYYVDQPPAASDPISPAAARVDPILLQQFLQKSQKTGYNPQMGSARPITGGTSQHHHRHQHHAGRGQYYGHQPHPHHYRAGNGGYLKPPPPVIPFHDPYEMSGFLPPPEYLRKMPPPMQNGPLPMPKLPCMDPASYEAAMASQPRGGNFYPPHPPPWRSMTPQNIYRGGPRGPPGGAGMQPATVPPAVNLMGSHPTRHFRSGSAMELHGR